MTRIETEDTFPLPFITVTGLVQDASTSDFTFDINAYKWIYWTLPGVHQCAPMYTDVNQFKRMYTRVEPCTPMKSRANPGVPHGPSDYAIV